MGEYVTVEKMFALLDDMVSWFLSKAGSIIITLIFLAIAFKLLKVGIKFIKKGFERSKLDPSVSTFLVSFINIGMKVVLLMMGASIIGFDVTSFLALLGSAGIAVGLAVQGSLSNLAGGVLILILKPFQVGDYIIEDSKGNEGTVVAIDIFYTKLQTPDNKVIVVPNGALSNSSLTNVTRRDTRRLDFNVTIDYSENINKTREILRQVISKEEKVLQDQEITIFVNSFDPSAVNLGVRVWVGTGDYWIAKWNLLENIKYAFDENNISIPFDQLDVNIKGDIVNLKK